MRPWLEMPPGEVSPTASFVARSAAAPPQVQGTVAVTLAGRRVPRRQTGPRPWLRKHRVGLLLLGTLCAGAAVRLVNLDALGFNSDEAVYAGQAAALAGNPNYALFPMFRAHPMLVQALLSPFFLAGEHDVVARVVIALLGVATLAVVYLLGKELYSPRVGLLAAAFMAVMPYHVVVTRQVLLDGPMVLFATVTLLFVVKYARTGRLTWMLAAGGAFGLTMLAKESSIVLAGSVYAFFALTPGVRRPVVASVLGFAVTLSMFALHPISVALSGHVSTTKAYLVWQLVRRPNHGLGFYLETVPWAVGPLVLVLAVLAVWLVKRRRQPAWREVLLVAWILVPTAAFTIWPTKGWQYLLACAPALAVLAARGVYSVPWRLPAAVKRAVPARLTTPGAVRGLVIGLVLVTLLVPLAPRLTAQPTASGLAGSGGIPGGREAGRWVKAHTPEGSVLMTLGPSMANIIQFYGQRKAYGLSVSPNPLMRNPSYEPIANPDGALRRGDMQYVVWDLWSAKRSSHFSASLKTLARRFDGRAVHTEYVGRGRHRVPVVIVYEVRP